MPPAGRCFRSRLIGDRGTYDAGPSGGVVEAAPEPM